MLDWKNLSWRQRLSLLVFALFALLVFSLSVFHALTAPQRPGLSARDVLAAIGVCSLMLGILLNPHFVRGSAAALKLQATPRVCKLLFVVALGALLLRGVLGVVTVQ